MLVVPTVHLASFFHAAAESKHGDIRGIKPITDCIRMDYLKAYEMSEHGRQHEEHLVCLLPGGPVDFMTYFETAKSWMRYWLQAKPALAVDVESTSLDYAKCRLHSIAIAEGAPNNVAVAFPLLDLRLLPEALELELLVLLRQILTDEQITKIFQNAPFDMGVLDRKGLRVRGPICDTMGLHHLVQPDIPHDLGFMGHTYLQVGPWKLEYKSNEGFGVKIHNPWKLLIYNAKDALYTVQLVPRLTEHIHARGMSDELIFWQNSYAELARTMENTGIPVNMVKRRAMGVEKLKFMLALRKRMREWLDWPDFSPRKPADKQEALFGAKYAQAPWNLGLVPTATTKARGDPSTGYRAIIDHIEHPFVAMLVALDEESKAYATCYQDDPDEERKKVEEAGGSLADLGTFNIVDRNNNPIDHVDFGPEDLTEDLMQVVTNRVCGAYAAAIVGTGEHRVLYTKWKPFDQKGIRFTSSPNVANQREDDRKFFEAPPGWCLVGSDKNNLELRLNAGAADCKALIEVIQGKVEPASYFCRKVDPHTFAAVNVFGRDYWERKTPEERDKIRKVTKNVEFCGFYLGGPEKIWRTSRENKRVDMELRRMMTLDLVREIHRGLFHGLFHEIYEKHEQEIDLVKRQGFMEIPPFGRRRYSPVMPPPVTEFANWRIQCRGAEIVTSEMCQTQWELDARPGNSAHCIFHGHDQAVFLARENDAEDVARVFMKHFGNTPMETAYGTIYLDAEPSTGKSLYEAK